MEGACSDGGGTSTAAAGAMFPSDAAIGGMPPLHPHTRSPPFQGERAGVTWVLYMDSPGGHCTERLNLVRGVESWEALTELSDNEAAQGMLKKQPPKDANTPIAAAATTQAGSSSPTRLKKELAARPTNDGDNDGEIPSHSVRTKTKAKTKKGVERSLDDLFAMSNHSSTTRRQSTPNGSALKKSNHGYGGAVGGGGGGALLPQSTSDDDTAREESDSLLAVVELASQTEESSSGNAHDSSALSSALLMKEVPARTISHHTTLSEDDTIVGSDKWSVAGGGSVQTLASELYQQQQQHARNPHNGWDAVGIPASLARKSEWDDGDQGQNDNVVQEVGDYWSSIKGKGKPSLNSDLAAVSADVNGDVNVATPTAKKVPSSKGRNVVGQADEQSPDKGKPRRSHVRRSEEEKAALTSSDEDQKGETAMLSSAPASPPSRASQKRTSHKDVDAKGKPTTAAASGSTATSRVISSSCDGQRSPSKRHDKKGESEKKQTRSKKPTKSLDLEKKDREPVPLSLSTSLLQESTAVFADEEQSIDPLTNFSQRKPLQRLLSPPGKVRPKQDQSLIARVNISPRKRLQPKFQTDTDDDESEASSASEEEGRSSNRSSIPYLDQAAARRREEASSSGELHPGGVPTQNSLDRNNASGMESQQTETSMSTMGTASEMGYGNSVNKSLQMLERSNTSSGDESSESNTSGYSFGMGLRHLNPNANITGLLNARANGQFVQLNLEGKEGVQVVDSLHVRSEHRSGLHTRKVIPDELLARSASELRYDDAASEQPVKSDDVEHNRSSVGRMFSDMNVKNFRRSTGSKQTKFSEGLLSFGGRRPKNADNQSVAEPADGEHETKKFFGRNSLQKARSDRKLLVDDDESDYNDA